MIVHGDDGLDEITTTASTKISHLQYDGKIIKILVEDGTPIEYDQPLMILKK